MNRFIVNKKDDFFKVEFVTKDSFVNRIRDYNVLHAWNVDFYKNLIDEFYADIWNDWTKKIMQLDLAKKELLRDIYFEFYLKFKDNINRDVEIDIFNYEKENLVTIQLDFTQEMIEFLNKKIKIRNFTARWLKKWFKYEGKFNFDIYNPLPF